MTTIELQEIKENIGEVIHQARVSGESVGVTEDGTLVAYLLPVRNGESLEAGGEKIDLDALVAEISAHWPKGVSAVDAVRDVRREL